MASTYSTNLAIELIGTGDQAGTWGNTTNTNLGTLIEQAISGYVTQAVATGTDTTITIPNGATGVARNMYIELTGTGGTNTNLIVPANKKLYFIFNNSTGAVTVKVSGQTGVSVPQGKKVVLVSNGTDVVNGLNYIADFGSNSATITQLSATSATITNLTLTSLVISNLSIASANVTTLTSSSATITNLLGTTLTISGNSFLATSSGNVGIGTSSPVGRVDSVSNASSAFTARASTTGANQTATVLNVYNSDASLFALAKYNAVQHIWGYAGASEGMRLDTSGNLGIGTASPVGRLHITTASGNTDFIHNVTGTGTAARTVYQRGGAVQFYAGLGAWSGTDTYQIAGASGPLTTLDSSGNLGIGTTVPARRLHVLAADGITNSLFSGATYALRTQSVIGVGTVLDAVAANESTYQPLVAGGSIFAFQTGGTERMRLDASGNLGLGVTPSAWNIGKTLELPNGVSLSANSGLPASYLATNARWNSGWIYTTSAAATYYNQQQGAHTWYTAPSGTAGNAITFTQAMTLTATGALNLTPGSGNNAYIECAGGTLSAGSTSMLFGQGAGGEGYCWNRNNSYTAFGTNGTERARITSGGRFLIATTDDAFVGNLIVQQATSANEVITVFNSATSGDNVFIKFFTDNGIGRGQIDYNRAGGAVRYNTTSDYRAKDVYDHIQNAGETIDALKVYRGKMKGATIERPMMIAHEAQQVVPYAVGGEKDAVNEDGTPKYQTMDHQILVPLLIAELQSLRKRVAELEAK